MVSPPKRIVGLKATAVRVLLVAKHKRPGRSIASDCLPGSQPCARFNELTINVDSPISVGIIPSDRQRMLLTVEKNVVIVDSKWINLIRGSVDRKRQKTASCQLIDSKQDIVSIRICSCVGH